jgi:hypothetical protein
MSRRSIFAHVMVASAFVGALAIAQPERKQDARPAQDPQPQHPQGQPDFDEGMAAWQQAMAPGEPHRWLAQMEGEWEITIKVFMDPGAEAMTSTGTSTSRMILGGRFLEEELSGSLMGMPFEGKGLFGYDNHRKQFTGSWADNMTTAILTQKGSLSPDGKTLTMFGEMDEPMTGEIGKIVKYQTTIDSPDSHTFRIQEVQYGDPFTVVEIVYQRKQ